MKIDASDGVIAEMLSQKNPQQQWHPITFYSKIMASVKYNYKIYDKEILAVIQALGYWRAELQRLLTKFMIYTDHEALKYFGTKQLLNNCQV